MSSSEAKLIQTDFRLCPKCNKLHTALTTCPACASSLTLVDYTFFLGKTLGKYTIKKVLGAGGMGIVFQALHNTLNKKVAVKIFVPSSDDPSFEKRFLREAQILAGLNHPNIVEVYDFDISEWGTPFYVMEYLEGKTLGEVIKGFPKGLPVRMVESLIEPVFQGLSHAHKNGIVHRDLKPENIFIEEIQDKQVVRILDFGIAKSITAGDEAATLTATKTVLGTPYYIAPEQVLNKNVGTHTDQYALALIIAEMLSGVVIRSGKNVGEILFSDAHKQVQLEDSILKKIPGELKQPLVKATRLEPEKRFPDINSFGSAVLKGLYAAGSKGTYRIPTAPSTKDVRLEGKKKQMLWLSLAAVSVLLILIIVYMLVPFGDKTSRSGTGGQKPEKQADFLILKQSVAIPPDAVKILTFQENTLVVQGPGTIYLIDIESTAPPTGIPLEERIVRGLPGGNLVSMDNFSITSRNFIDGGDSLLVRNPPAGEQIKISESGQFLAVKKGTVLTLYRVDRQKLHPEKVKSITTPKENPGFVMEISDRYFVLFSGGRIHAYGLEPFGEILNQAVESSGTGFIAVQDNQSLAALAGGDGKIRIYNLKEGSAVQTVSEPGETLAVEFFPNAPVLIISKPGGLLFHGLPGKDLARYEEPGLAAVDLVLTTHGLMALDKKTGRINIYRLLKNERETF